MSDFPEPGRFRSARSEGHLKAIPVSAEAASRLVLSRKKEAYLMDLDGQKFVDFYLNDGGVIAGHSHRALTQFAKDGLSIGQTGGFFCRSHLKLLKNLCTFAISKSAACFEGETHAFLALFRAFQPRTVAVNSRYLQDFLSTIGCQASLMNSGAGEADLLVYEPLDMEKSLEMADVSAFRAKTVVCFEGRTAFRVAGVKPSKDCLRMFGRSLANGLPFSAITGGGDALPGEAVPAYLAESVIGTLNLIGRKGELRFEGQSGLVKALNGGLLKLKRSLREIELLPYGVYARGDLLCLSHAHTAHDQERLFRALNAISSGGQE